MRGTGELMDQRTTVLRKNHELQSRLNEMQSELTTVLRKNHELQSRLNEMQSEHELQQALLQSQVDHLQSQVFHAPMPSQIHVHIFFDLIPSPSLMQPVSLEETSPIDAQCYYREVKTRLAPGQVITHFRPNHFRIFLSHLKLAIE
jgi:hypothetical protein